LLKTDFLGLNALISRMDNQPKTRKESKKDQKEKGQGKNGKYTQKGIRAKEQQMSKIPKP
jgi:hypothetical protein